MWKSPPKFTKRLPNTDVDRIELRRLNDVIDWTDDRMTRTKAHKDKGKVIRRIRKREASLAVEQAIRTRRPVAVRFRPVRVPYFQTEAGIQVFSDAEKKNELYIFFKNLWSDSGVVRRLPDWICKRWNPEVLAGYKQMNGLMLREVALDMGKGKAVSHDGAVAEMVAELDELILDELAEVFRLRVLNHASEDLKPAWEIHKVSLS